MDKNKNNTLKRKLRVLEKAVGAGFKTEKDFANLSAKEYHDLQKKCKFREVDSDIFFELSESIKKNRLISYLADNTETENGGGDSSNGTQVSQTVNEKTTL